MGFAVGATTLGIAISCGPGGEPDGVAENGQAGGSDAAVEQDGSTGGTGGTSADSGADAETSNDGTPPTDATEDPPDVELEVAPDVVADTGPRRVSDGLQVLYTFDEGSGSVVRDVSGRGAPLDLDIQDPAAVDWIPGGLIVNGPNLIVSPGPATKVIDACTQTNELSIEAWIKPEDTTLEGPARIVTLSEDTSFRNFTLGMTLSSTPPTDTFTQRVRTTLTTLNGIPSLSSPEGSASANLTHVISIRPLVGSARVYVNAQQEAAATVEGDFSVWDPSYALGLANEMTLDRVWLGELYLVAVYCRALSPPEVEQNFQAGPDGR